MFTVNSPGAVRLRRRGGGRRTAVRSADDVVFVWLELVVVVVLDGVIIPLSPPVFLPFFFVFLFVCFHF